jgi:cell division septation protein DedD
MKENKIERTMKKNILSLTAFFFLALDLCAQSPGPKWEKVFESNDETVFVDTSSIRQFEKQISAMSMTYYKKPQVISSIGNEAVSLKSQLLFNAATKKYTLIGTLYYDRNLKILGETSLPGFASGSESFSLPVEGNAAMNAVFNKTVEYLKIGITSGETVEAAPAAEKNSGSNIPLSQSDKRIIPSVTDPQVSGDAPDRVAMYLNKKDSVEKASLRSSANKNESKQQPNVKQRQKDETSTPVVTDKKKDSPAVSETPPEKETNPKSTIFKEGSKYSFQVSSWKNRSKAESEVNRMKNKGHNSFLAEGIVNGVTWYRVRIGYFDSLEETETYMKKIR